MNFFTARKGLCDIRSSLSAKLFSKSKGNRAQYLELYQMEREKQRLQQELFIIGKRKKRLDDSLLKLQERISSALEQKPSLEQEHSEELRLRLPKAERIQINY